jgi:hypothetical protein
MALARKAELRGGGKFDGTTKDREETIAPGE